MDVWSPRKGKEGRFEMTLKSKTIVWSVSVAVLLASCAIATTKHRTDPKSLKAAPKYKAVADLFNAKCLSCHNEKNHPEKVDLSSYKALMASGEKGPIVMAGKPDKSKLVMYIDGTKQPR